MAPATSGTAKVTLPADDQILIEREFAAPAHLVWRSVTEPELVRRWWHAGRGEMTRCEIDLRVGGTWRYAMRPEGGEEFAFYGEFLELVPGREDRPDRDVRAVPRRRVDEHHDARPSATA